MGAQSNPVPGGYYAQQKTRREAGYRSIEVINEYERFPVLLFQDRFDMAPGAHDLSLVQIQDLT